MKRTMLIAGLAVAAFCSGALAMEGKAVTSIRYMLSPFWGPQPTTRDRLVVATLSGNRVSQIDTLLKGGPFYHPTWSFDGQRIAFYRSGEGLSVINADGTGLRRLAVTGDWTWNGGEGGEGMNIAWPGAEAGKWIYYCRPPVNNGEIWRINVDDTTRNELVCDYTKSNDRAQLSRWYLSADTKYGYSETSGSDNAQLGYVGGVTPHTFPPMIDQNTGWINPNLTEPSCPSNRCSYRGDCNGALSASGTILYHFTGGHTTLYANYWDHAAGTITETYAIGTGGSNSMDQYRDCEGWLAPGSPDIGATFVYPRASSNSDQIVSVLCLNRYGAEYAHNSEGSNLLVANWKDKEAIFATTNPDMRAAGACCISEGTYFWYDEPGDFWLQTPAGKEGCYEDVNGQWIAVPGAVTDPSVATRYAPIRSTSTRQGPVTVYDLRGARVGIFNANAFARNLSASPRTYVVTAPDSKRGVAMLHAGRSSR